MDEEERVKRRVKEKKDRENRVHFANKNFS